MKKTMTLLPYLRKSYAKGTLQMLAVMCLLGTGVVNTSAQTRETSEKVTSNLHKRVKLMRSVNGGTLKLFLAAELPSRVEREHWPIVFVSKTNAAGEEIQVMQNLVGTEEFVLDIAATKNNVSVSGEDGLWTVDANNQSISGVELTTPSLRYLQLSHNEVKTGTTAGEFVLPGSSSLEKLENLDLSFNKLLKLNLAAGSSTLKQVVANGNGLKDEDYSALTKLTYMNLQGNRLEKIKVPAAFVPNAKIFDVSRLAGVNNYEDPYKDDLANQTTYGNNFDHRFFSNHEGELNLSINKLKISTLPKVPAGIDVAKREVNSGKYKRPMFNVAAQERLSFPKNVYALKEAIDLSSEYTAYAQNGTAHNTTYTWYIEKEAGTDEYVPISKDDYDVVAGVTKFKRGFGRQANIFAVLRNEAFDTPLANPKNSTESFGVGLSSFELDETVATPTDGYKYTTQQPSGTAYAIASAATEEQKEVGSFTVVSNETSVKSKIEDAPNAQRHLSQYRTKVISLKGNYWYGFEDNDWSKAENWTMRYVPLTTPTEYATLTGDKSEANVEFATNNTSQYGENAIRDLHTDGERVVEKYINHSESKKALVVQATHKLTIQDAVDVTKDDDDGKDLPELLRVKAGDKTTANGSLFVASKKPVNATVELFAQSSNQGSGLQRANWQYFGAPVNADYNTKKNVFGSALVRKYNRTLTVANSDEKWEALNDGDVIKPGEGYEVATPTPTRFEFKGALNYKNTVVGGEDAFEFALDGAATGTNYNDINILANPFTAAMKIADIKKKDNAANVVGTVYLFNTGSRENWLAKNGATTTGNDAGQYTQAVPIGLAGALPGQVTEIPSLSSFAVKANGPSSIYYRYADLVKTETANRARRMDASAPRVASITVDVASEKSMDRLWLVEHEDATENFDNDFDGEKMLTAGAAQLYAEGAQNLQVSTTKHLTRANLSFIPADKAERYELKFHLDGFNASDEFVLLDKRTGAETKINDGDKYSFIADRNDKRQRFAILRKGASLNDAAQAGFTVLADATRNIEVLNETSESGEVIIVDAAGRSLARFTLAAGARKNVQVNVPGVYVVKAENTQSRFSQSVLVP